MNRYILPFSLLALLFIPLILMHYTTEVKWSNYDFFIMGLILFYSGLIVNLIINKTKNLHKRLIIISIVIFLFFLLWAELGVGIFNSPLSGN